MPKVSSIACQTTSADTASRVLDYSGDTIQIIVKDVKFCVPKNIICRTSAFFRNAAKPEWEGDEGPSPIVLEDDTVQAFQLYTVWLYNDSIERADNSLKTWEPLSEAYVMGEKFMDAAFQRVIFEAMMKRCKSRNPSIKVADRIYRGTCPRSPGRQLMIDICLWNNRNCLHSVENPAVELHEDLVRDLLTLLMAGPKPQKLNPTWLSVDNYLEALELEHEAVSR